ncbi:MAG: MASE3 domain-containing protein [bacterium]
MVLLGLYLTSLYHYLLFHNIAELFSIIIAASIFIFAWNSRQLTDNSYLLFLGIAYLFIGIIDLLHTLTYPGMNIFQGYGTNLPTQLWIGARYLESITLFLAPLFLKLTLKNNKTLFLIYFSAVLLLLGSIFYWQIFPDCFIEGGGLTRFKKMSEYMISFILLCAIIFHVVKQNLIEQKVFYYIIVSIITTICAELAFTLYAHAYSLSNLVGHYFKILSFYYIYKAIVEIGLRSPYNLLFSNLKKSERALRESKMRLNSLVQSANDAIISIDNQFTIISWNKGAQAIYGYEVKEIIGKPLTMLISDLSKTSLQNIVKHIDAIDKAHMNNELIELESVKKDGTEFPSELSFATWKEKEKLFYSCIVRDITERKKAEEILKRDKEDIEKLVNEKTTQLFRAQKELEQAKRLSDIGTLAAIVAHELRNPLGVIQAATYNIKRKNNNTSIDTHIKNIDKKISEGNQIINNLLAYSRIKMPHYSKISIYTLLNECIINKNKIFSEKRITIDNKCESIKHLFIEADPFQLGEVFNNILDNAYQSCQNNSGKIEIKAHLVKEKAIRISFKDNGMGIDKEDLEKVFTPFFTKKSKGTGLGLTISNELVNIHGGSIGIESEKGKGTTITIDLPTGRE